MELRGKLSEKKREGETRQLTTRKEKKLEEWKNFY